MDLDAHSVLRVLLWGDRVGLTRASLLPGGFVTEQHPFHQRVWVAQLGGGCSCACAALDQLALCGSEPAVTSCSARHGFLRQQRLSDQHAVSQYLDTSTGLRAGQHGSTARIPRTRTAADVGVREHPSRRPLHSPGGRLRLSSSLLTFLLLLVVHRLVCRAHRCADVPAPAADGGHWRLRRARAARHALLP